MKRSIVLGTFGFWLAASTAFAKPFGGDDGGCTPPGALALKCGISIGRTVAKLESKVWICHRTQASRAFQAGHSSPGFDAAEANCTEGPSASSAKAKFDAALAKYALACGPGLVAAAEARRDVILADRTNLDSFDAVNGAFFCDPTSGLTIAEPGGGEAGFIPADPKGHKCAVSLGQAWTKLRLAIAKCHFAAAKTAFRGGAFDDEPCEQKARAKYDALVQKLALIGCPACLTTGAPALADDANADLDAQLEELFPCPPEAAPCDDLGGGQCSDTCATPGFECLFVPTGFDVTGIPGWPDVHGQDDCRCVPAQWRCENLGAAICAVSGGDGGLCPNASESCEYDGGDCGCQ